MMFKDVSCTDKSVQILLEVGGVTRVASRSEQVETSDGTFLMLSAEAPKLCDHIYGIYTPPCEVVNICQPKQACESDCFDDNDATWYNHCPRCGAKL